MSSPLTVSQWRQVSRTLAAAFQDDPVFSWLIPNDAARARALPRYFAVEVRHLALHFGCSNGVVEGGDVLSAAIVLPPGEWSTSAGSLVKHGPALVAALRGRWFRGGRLLGEIERHHPHTEHYYFPYIGVSPTAQGRGLGTASMRPALDRCDAEGLPAYLEASNPRCAKLYERLGFETLREIRPLGAPPLQLMLRPPS
ncbi:GNAT family N-acetyltransferase [Jatrophihabitans sp.]|uniref:GNAT family N-acetyltransferase n=1 Tax=Jatrophihabitans sp. TaxID=1932789 RepID=UPI0030C74480|nr:Acetyltransferase family protein [Jatrophihabitans sp.]